MWVFVEGVGGMIVIEMDLLLFVDSFNGSVFFLSVIDVDIEMFMLIVVFLFVGMEGIGYGVFFVFILLMLFIVRVVFLSGMVFEFDMIIGMMLV